MKLGPIAKVALSIVGTIVLTAALAWIYRAELALSAAGYMMSRTPIEPTREVPWSGGGPDPQGRPLEERPPNVVLILADDLGWNDLSWNGGGLGGGTVQTPNIDRLAREGIDFRWGYTAHGACAPSRAAIMSGRYGSRFGFYFTPTPTAMAPVLGVLASASDRPGPPMARNPEAEFLDQEVMAMPPSEITIAELLRDQGYYTAHIGKWHLGVTEGKEPHDQGFQDSLLMGSGLYGRLDDPDVIDSRQEFDPIDRFLWAGMRFAASFNDGPLFEPPRYLTDFYTDEAVKVIEKNRDRPFFLYLAHWTPHTPLQASREDYDQLSHIPLHRERVYAGMVRSLDRSVGRVMDALEANGLAENTLVLFASDNGGAGYIGIPDVNMPYRGWKLSLFEGGVRTPFFARWPARIPAGVTYEEPVHHFDLYATAAAAAGAPLPTDRKMDGVDLLPYALGEVDGTPHEKLFWVASASSAVLSGRYKLVRSTPHGLPHREWLFDLEADPGQRHDLSSDRPDLVEELRAALEAHLAAQAPPLWLQPGSSPINLDRDLSQEPRPDDEWVYF
jgi:uncharacterized sulfatase